MKAREIHELSDEELDHKLAQSKTDLFNLRFQHATGQLENPKRLTEVRKEIARIFTVIKERELKKAAEGGAS